MLVALERERERESRNLGKIEEREGLYSLNRPLFICTTKLTQGEGVNDNASNILKMQSIRKNNSMQSTLNAMSGITLIALVVTIVVLLILASVSITVVFGDNGLIEMAREAANKTNETVEKDLGDIQNLTNELNDFMNPPTPEPPTEVTSGNTQEKYIDIGDAFTIKVKDSTEEITVSAQNEENEVVTVAGNTVTGKKVGDATLTATWSGSNSATINVHVYDPETIGAPKRIEDYGKMVVGYTDTEANANSGGYRLFYQDKNYTYLISDSTIALEDISTKLYGSDYPNGASIKENSIGQMLNPMLKDAQVNGEKYNFFEAGNTKDNIKAVGWLTDPKNWTEYTNGEEGVLAIGGPTLELFAASYNSMDKVENGKVGNIILEVGEYGYICNGQANWLKNSQRQGIYYSDSFILASPPQSRL